MVDEDKVKATAPRQIALCADDVGLAGVAETVAGLAAAHRLSSASCLATAPAWRAEGTALAAATQTLPGFGLGLHFNLTEGTPLSPDLAALWPVLPGLKELIVRAHLGRLPLAALASEWQAQLDAFTEATGRPPAHVDGHQHVHHLPHIRELVLDAIDAAFDTLLRPAVRSTGRVVGPGHGLKRLLIEGTGGRDLLRELQRRGLRHNTGLLGVYDFREADYRRLMRRWLAAAPPRGALLFSHPGPDRPRGDDAIGAARQREAAYLASAAFVDDLGAAGFSVAAAWQSSSAG